MRSHNFRTPRQRSSPAALPQARVLALCEVGTHVLWRTQIKPCQRSEVKMAAALLNHREEGMLLLWDRGFLSFDLLRRVQKCRAHLLARVKTKLVFRPLNRLRDGSYLAKIYRSPQHWP